LNSIFQMYKKVFKLSVIIESLFIVSFIVKFEDIK
jgi:hypothetical protein